jgi:hypothetical protein
MVGISAAPYCTQQMAGVKPVYLESIWQDQNETNVPFLRPFCAKLTAWTLSHFLFLKTVNWKLTTFSAATTPLGGGGEVMCLLRNARFVGIKKCRRDAPALL